MRKAAAIVAGWLSTAGVAGAEQMDVAVFNGLRRGMDEGEVLVRAGQPDLVTAPGGSVIAGDGWRSHVLDSGPRVKLHYIPGPGEHDPWLTVITLTSGRVSALERRKMFGPVNAPPPVLAPAGEEGRRARTDDDVLRDRADRTLEAAERYADVRARIKERAEQEAAGGDQPVYRGTDDEGAPYFGDVPPRDGEAGVR